jgi:hypothetical protein
MITAIIIIIKQLVEIVESTECIGSNGGNTVAGKIPTQKASLNVHAN